MAALPSTDTPSTTTTRSGSVQSRSEARQTRSSSRVLKETMMIPIVGIAARSVAGVAMPCKSLSATQWSLVPDDLERMVQVTGLIFCDLRQEFSRSAQSRKILEQTSALFGFVLTNP